MTILETLKDWNKKAGKLVDTYSPIIERELGIFSKGLSKVSEKYQDEKKNAPKDKPKPLEVRVVNPCLTGSSSRKEVRPDPNEYAGRGVSDKLFKPFKMRKW